tara:strand:+ start:195 stop:359 length:165 start_codon:yes stop_codon:yes gene_type:complete
MPKYILIALIVVLTTFLIVNYWPKLKETHRNKIITSIFGIIAIGFVILLALLLF